MSGQRHATLVAAASLALTLTPLLGVFTGIGWTVPVLLTVAVVSTAASLIRAAGRGQGLQTLAMVAALTAVMTAAFNGGTAVLFVIPTLDTFAFWLTTINGGINDIITLAPPVAAEDGILFLTMLGVGIVAILHDMFIVGLRTPALSGLTLLTMYLVPVSVAPEATAWFWFVLPAAAYLWILGDDNLRRVSRFGHRFTGQGRLVGPRFPSPLAGTARTSGALFITATLMLLAVIPTNTSGLVDQVAEGYGGGGGPGGGDLGAVDPWAKLYGQLNRPDPIDVARITTDRSSPGYLRMHVSDFLDPERGFGPSQWEQEDLAPLGSLQYTGGEVYEATVEVLDLPDPVAPVYGRPVEVDLNDDWGVLPDLNVVGSRRTGLDSVESYSFSFTDPEFDASVLNATDPLPEDDPLRERNTAHPEGFTELDSYLEEALGEAETDFEKVLAVQDYLSPTNGFSYSTATENSGDQSVIVDFLENKQGFCQQYATAMAWMLRAADVPSRVVIGLTRGTREGDEWVVSSDDYHAWVEVYFDGPGWVPFDPTPSTGVSGSVPFDWEEEPDPDTDSEDPDDAGATDRPDATDRPNEEPTLPGQEDPGETDETAGADDRAGPGPLGFDPAWLALALLVPLPFVPALWRAGMRRARLRPGRVTALGAWDETLDLAADYGVALNDSLTPKQTAAALAAAAPDAAAPAEALASAVAVHRYSGRGADTGPLPEAVTDLHRALDKSVHPRRRLRALFWPASLAYRFAAAQARGASRVGRLRSKMSWRRSNARGDGAVTGRP
ncbi:transglutaminase family protein [Glycomyces xiaoerkulensis]|uniref:transglutaminase family protein n=1 Tax=Glycomyces xiaoerkulensis TaxID=2038139 RepID=UPI000C2584B7|nr:DUF3488 and transglutaminase-like domain-containing protein [Glycomyces xiaoerkulensis]